jgi:hypothetical protein
MSDEEGKGNTATEAAPDEGESNPKPKHAPGDSGGDSGGDKGGSGKTDEVRAIIREELEKLRGEPRVVRRVDLEAEAERLVQEASDRIVKSKDDPSELEEVKAQLAELKKSMEKTPRKIRKITKLMWGDFDD